MMAAKLSNLETRMQAAQASEFAEFLRFLKKRQTEHSERYYITRNNNARSKLVELMEEFANDRRAQKNAADLKKAEKE